ncbi:hypothetical protein JCM8115_005535 [Rhodotorula mucilaginosa]|uniref:Zn(2)-C6 fungal-type domain-containing protein n=1 Tax=Rhodotorula mucilaginosa TaxID=5537 RepID=A0A9P7B8A3_RHOMI|nr:hypothetical protein C6P46_002439 [Rhodotorula mucilaginosa]
MSDRRYQYFYEEPGRNYYADKRPRPSPTVSDAYYEPTYDQYAGNNAYGDVPDGSVYVLPSGSATSGHAAMQAPAHLNVNVPQSGNAYREAYASYPSQSLDPRFFRNDAPPLPSTSAAEPAATWTDVAQGASGPNAFIQYQAPTLLPHTPAPSDPEVSAPAASTRAAEGKKAATAAPRRRRPASCTPCRQKKLRCNRAKPCTSCVERDTECIWEGDATPLYVGSQESDIEKLQAHIKQLESLVSAIPPTTAAQPNDGTPRQISHASSPASSTGRSATAPMKEKGAAREVERFDLVAQDLLGALISLVLSGVVTPPRAGRDSFLPNGQNGTALLQELKRLQDTHAGAILEMPVISALTVEDLTLPAIMALIPPEPKLRAAYDFFHEYFAWICPSVHVREIDKRWSAMKTALDGRDATPFAAPADAQFLALVLGVCTMGISRMPEPLAAQLGLVEEKETNGAAWARVASLVLHAGKPTEYPHLDGVRAANTIGVYHLLMTQGKTVPTGVSLISLGSHAAMELGLNRDPVDYPIYEREARKRTFWALFTISVTMTSFFSRSWSAFDLRYIDCAFPLDYHEDELEMDERAANARLRARASAPDFEETWISSQVFHFRIAYLAKLATDDLFAAATCSYEAVLAHDQKLMDLEASLPEIFQFGDFSTRPPTLTNQRAILLHLCLSAEVVRINRPFLALAAADDRYRHSRNQCIKYAKRELYIYSDKNGDWVEFSVSRFSAAMVLAIDLLSERPEDVQEKRDLLEFASLRLDLMADISVRLSTSSDF